MRTCSYCGKQAGYHKQLCEGCGEQLPKSHITREPRRTLRGQQRYEARCKLLDGMDAPACVCGLRGPHANCTRSREWRDEMLSLLAMRRF